ncbi:leucine-rich repeat protein [Acutalibacter sp. LFL-21]|uniref:leucine-rich repeat protein n=1 Tax=Acutalibacter sp. LFL-21 TaxID=2983399 RepID=UPI0021D69554|nr:leucine-rich repeat protein [Acutalibacter sp. LFL-21]
MPASVTSIGRYAFHSCFGLQMVTFGKESQLTAIEAYAFEGCTSLTSIGIPASVTFIGDHAFLSCTGLQTVTFDIDSKLETIGASAFQACTILSSINIPANVTSIGDHAFLSCNRLKTVTFNGVSERLTIGDGAFESCNRLKTVTFNGVSERLTIGDGAFESCVSLKTINIPTAQGYGGGNWPTGVNYVVRGTGGQTTTYRHLIVKKIGGDKSCTVTPGTSLVQVETQVTLTAVAGSGYYFTDWEEVNGVNDYGTFANQLSFTMPAADVTVTANFEKTTGIYIGKTPLKVNTYYVVPESSGWSQTVVETSTTPTDSYALLTGDDTTGYTLTLRNFSYTGPGYEYQTKNSGASGTYYYYAAIFANKNLTIDLEGKNSVTESGNYDNDGSYTTTYGIYVVGENLTVTGEGSLTATGGAINYNGSSYGACVLNGSLTVSGAELTGQGGTGYDSQGVSATSVTVQEDGKLTGIGGNSIGQSMGLYSGSLTVSGELVAKGGTAISSYGVQNSGAITIKVTSGRIVATGVSGKNYNSAVASNNDVIVKQDNPYAWRTQESGPYTYSDSDEGQYQYNRSDTYLEIASVHTLTVKQAEGGTVSVSPGGSNNCYPAGTDITLTATPNSGYQFSGWTVTGADVSDTTANPLTFTMPAHEVTVTAGWSPISSGGGVPSRPDPKPEGPSTGGSKGWENIQQELENAKDGETITIDMNGETEVPAEVWETIAGRDVTVILDMGENVSWTVDGNDVPAGASFGDMDFGVNLNTTGINVDVINAITGEVSSVQITLAHDGEFGFILTLTAPLGAENAGYWANLYHYDEDDETLNYETSGEIKEDGTARLRMTHASQYAIIIDKQTHQLPFTDVASGAWYEQAVRYAYLNGIMEGMGGTAFQPNGTLSRAMAVQILYNLEGQPDISGENLGYPYSDVDASQWYGNAVYWARITGVATGYGDGTFQPTDSITRQEFAQMLYNYAKYKDYDLSAQGDLSTFPDAGSIAGWAETAMSWANGEGLINGHENGLIDPTGTATRAQAASILTRFDQNVVEN